MRPSPPDEDLETLRLSFKVIPASCQAAGEREIPCRYTEALGGRAPSPRPLVRAHQVQSLLGVLTLPAKLKSKSPCVMAVKSPDAKSIR